MNRLDNIKLQSIVPSSIGRDEQVKALCQAIDVKLQRVAAETELVLLLPRLNALPEEIIDELAWQYHVDFYDYSASLEKKRSLVRQAIAWHKRKGTPAAVEEVCTAVFKTAKVFENWEYGGEPYHFQVRLIEEAVPDEQVIDNLFRAIKETKNTRSWLDGLSFFRKLAIAIYTGGVMSQHKSVDIYPAKFRARDINASMFTGAGIYYHREVGIV
mgnify:CR=1 FL=1|nr:MAG TPA_asm: tail protein [Caudoviricetes sp.]